MANLKTGPGDGASQLALLSEALCQVGTIAIPTLQLKKLRLRERQKLSYIH